MVKLIKHKFSDLYDFSSGISTNPAQAGLGSPFLSFSTVFDNPFLPNDLPDLMSTTEKEQEKFSIKKGDIFLTRTSETIDELGMSAVALKDYPSATYSGFLKRLRPLKSNMSDPKYMAFYLRSPLFRKTMTYNAVLTLRASLNEQIFSYLDLLLPDYDYQVLAGNFLFNISKKIELNNRINTELDFIIKTIYDYWFVQFDFPNENGTPYKSSGGKMIWSEELKREIPEGWEVKELEEIILRSGTGLNPRKNFTLGKGKNFYITIKNVKNGKIRFDDSCDKINDEALQIIDKRSDLQVGDVLFTSIQPVGVTYLIHEKPKNWNINESVFTIRPNNKEVTPEYLFLLLSSEEMKTFTSNASAGSIHKGIRHSVLKTFKLPYGNKALYEKFSNVLNPILRRVHLIDKENLELFEIQNWLIPMIINGQVKSE